MPRRDQLTYDVGQKRRFSLAGLNPRLLALLIIVVVLAVLLVVWTASTPSSSTSGADHGSRAVAAPSSPAPSSAPSGTPTAAPSAAPSQVLSGSDASQTTKAPGHSQAAAVRFVTAWLERVPAKRKAELQQTATSGLAEELMLTSAANIPNATAKGQPRLEDASEFSAQFVQALSDGMRIRLYLVADPQSKLGWLVTSVEEA